MENRFAKVSAFLSAFLILYGCVRIEEVERPGVQPQVPAASETPVRSAESYSAKMQRAKPGPAPASLKKGALECRQIFDDPTHWKGFWSDAVRKREAVPKNTASESEMIKMFKGGEEEEKKENGFLKMLSDGLKTGVRLYNWFPDK